MRILNKYIINTYYEEKGSSVIEFAFALTFLFFFFIMFIQFFEIFISHERLSFASFVTSRVSACNNATQARSVGKRIDSDSIITITFKDKVNTIQSTRIKLKKNINLQVDLNNIYSTHGGRFKVDKLIETFKEHEMEGDN